MQTSGNSSESMGLMLAQVDAFCYDVMSGDECLPDVFDTLLRAYACRKG